MEIQTRLEAIRDRMERACQRAGRSFGSVVLVAVTKTRSVDEIRSAVEAGVTDIGENRVQEAEPKREALASKTAPGGVLPRWHLVGHLQKNKAKKAVQIFDRIHSLDSVDLGVRLDHLAQGQSKQQSVLVQVDLASEETKFGLPEKDLFPALEDLSALSHLRIDGLMVLPPYLPDAEKVRPFFRRLRELSEKAREELGVGGELSMGMSHDFEVAIEEGATLVRIGTALFGPRPGPAAAENESGETE